MVNIKKFVAAGPLENDIRKPRCSPEVAKPLGTRLWTQQILDQVISCVMTKRRLTSGRAPGPGLQLSWSMHALTNRSHRLQATSFKQQAPSNKLDMKDIMGYSIIKKNETRTYAQLNASRPRTVVTRRKYCSRNCSALEATDPGFLFTQRFKLQAASIKPFAARFKRQAASGKLLDHGPWKKF